MTSASGNLFGLLRSRSHSSRTGEGLLFDKHVIKNRNRLAKAPMKIAVFGENGRKYAHRIDTKHFGNALLRNSHSFFRFYPSKEWSNVQIKSNSALRGCKMLKPSTERREITSSDRFFAKTSLDARRDLREIEKWIRSPPPGALHFYGRANAKSTFPPAKSGSTRAEFTRSRRRKTHFQIRTARRE